MLCILLTLSLLTFNLANAFSVCDEIDITFVVDVDNVIHNTDVVVEFIISIINDGSSEQTGFSVVLYGDKIPKDFDIKIITLEETASITQRLKAEAEVDGMLEKKFNQIIEYAKDKTKPTKEVPLLQAFKVGNKQLRPKRDLNYKTKLGYNVNDPTVGGNDDDKVYFIFDYNNGLMYDDMDDICALFHHLDTNAVENDDESIHFLLGQEYNKYDLRSIVCKNKKPDQIKDNTFFHFEDELLFNKEIMERVYDITCPATIQAPTFGGSMNLGNHVQWMDIETVLKCNLAYYDFGSKSTQEQMDITKSYIQVKDYLNDDNTFKRNDYLLTIEKNLAKMEAMGCTAPVVKIERIETAKKIYEKGKPKQYQILKLFVTLPKSPLEYILDCKIKGDVGVEVDDKHVDQHNNPYNSAYNDEFYGVSIEAAGIEYANSLSDADLEQYVSDGLKTSVTNFDENEYYSNNWFDEDFDDYTFDYDGEQNLEDFYHFMDVYNSGDYGEYEQSYNDEKYDDYSEDELESIYDFFNLNADDFSTFDQSDIAELYDIYNEYMRYKYGWPSWQGIKDKAAAVKAATVAKAAAVTNGARSAVNSGLNAAKAYGKQKVTQAAVAAVAVGSAVSKYVPDAIKDRAKFTATKTALLKKLAFKGDYKWEKTKTSASNIKGPNGMKIKFSGTGQVTVTYGYEFNFEMSVTFNFNWLVFKNKVHIEVKLHGTWDIMAYANIRIMGKMQVLINKILNYGHTFTIWVYGVPVVIRPYVNLDAKIKTVPLEIFTGVRYNYGEKFAVGYYYDNFAAGSTKSYPIKERHTLENKLTKIFRLQESQNRDMECPIAKGGFDVIIMPTIGVELYYIISTNMRFNFIIPFRVTLPEKNLKMCRRSGDMCATADKALFASFSVKVKLDIYIGAFIDTQKFSTVIQGLTKKQKPKPQKLPKPRGKKVGSLTIMKKKSLGCKKLIGALKPANDYYRSKCCDGNAAKPEVSEVSTGEDEQSGSETGHESSPNGKNGEKPKKRPRKRPRIRKKKAPKKSRKRTPKKSNVKKSKKSEPKKRPTVKTGVYCDKRVGRYRSRKTGRFVPTPRGKVCRKASTKVKPKASKSSKRPRIRKKKAPKKSRKRTPKKSNAQKSNTQSTPKKPKLKKRPSYTKKSTPVKTGVYCDQKVGRYRSRNTGRFVQTPRGKVCRKASTAASAKGSIYCDKKVGRFRDRKSGRFAKTPEGKVCRKETSSTAKTAKTGVYCDKRVGRYRSRRTGRFVKTPTGKVCNKSKK